MTDAKEAAERIRDRIDTAIRCAAAQPGREYGSVVMSVADLQWLANLLSQPGEEEVKRMVARLSAMGLVVVPREPTGAMQVAAVDWMLGINGFKPNEAVGVWSAMLQASPKVQP